MRVANKNEQENEIHLKHIFQRLSYCIFSKQKRVFLGYTSDKRITPIFEKSISNTQFSSNIVTTWLFHMSHKFYRCFISNCSYILYLLTDLLKTMSKNIKFNAAMTIAFINVMNTLADCVIVLKIQTPSYY